jgi:hypothetical protein
VIFVQSIVAKIHAARQHTADKAEYRAQLMNAVSDGVLTVDELKHLQAIQHEMGLTPEEIGVFRVAAYQGAFAAAKADGTISAEEEQELSQIKSFLGVLDSEVVASSVELGRYRLLREIQEGNPPSITVSGLVTQKGELPYWSEPGSILEEKVVDRQYVGRSQGVSLRIAKGVSYRVGAQRGHLVSQTGIVPVSTGNLVVTSKRVMFIGDKKGFNLQLDKVLSLELHSDGITIVDSSSKPHVVQSVSSGNAEVVGAILSYAVNRLAV